MPLAWRGKQLSRGRRLLLEVATNAVDGTNSHPPKASGALTLLRWRDTR